MRSFLKIVICLLLGMWALLPVVAQHEDDDDLAEQDRRYHERYTRPETTPATPETDDVAAAFRATADKLIRDKHYRRETTEEYDVQSDDPRVRVDLVTRLLGEFRREFENYWSGRIELRPYDDRSRVYLFYSFFKYNQLLSEDFSRNEQRPKGHYNYALDVLTLHTDSDAPGGLADTLIHEAAHQLVDQRLYGPDRSPPLWVSEGLASFFGYAYRDEGGRFHPERIGGKSLAVLRGAKPGSGREAAARLRAVREQFRRSESSAGEIVRRVIGIRDPAQFYFDGNAQSNYGVSWLLVHYLLHGDDGRHAEGFVRFLRLDADSGGTPEALYREIGLGAEELGTALAGYAKRLKGS